MKTGGDPRLGVCIRSGQSWSESKSNGVATRSGGDDFPDARVPGKGIPMLQIHRVSPWVSMEIVRYLWGAGVVEQCEGEDRRHSSGAGEVGTTDEVGSEPMSTAYAE